MLKKILIALGILLVALVLVGLVLPKGFECQRSVVIQAPPAKIHPLLSDLKRWDEWAPWKEADPTIVTKFGDTTQGAGASQSWTGEGGDGWLRITHSDPATGIKYDMAFIQDGKETPATGWMGYAPAGTGTLVEWGMVGTADMPIIGGYFALMSGLFIGPMFDKGLAKLKTRAEQN